MKGMDYALHRRFLVLFLFFPSSSSHSHSLSLYRPRSVQPNMKRKLNLPSTGALLPPVAQTTKRAKLPQFPHLSGSLGFHDCNPLILGEMGLLVPCHLVGPREALITSDIGALEGPFPCMNPEMLGQVGGFSEPLVTPLEFTLEGLLACVDSSMDGQCARDGKLSSTTRLCALEGLFARMSSHMLCHDVGLGEPFLTDLTLERFVTRMGLDMTHGLLTLSESSALTITIDPFTDVFTLAHPNVVLTQMAGERLELWERELAPTPETWVLMMKE